MKAPRIITPLDRGQHALGQAGAPTLLFLAARLDAGFEARFVQPLRRLHARGAANFSAWSQADVRAAGKGSWARVLRVARPVAVVLADYEGEDGAEIVAYCHHRGLPVTCFVGKTENIEALAELLETCDALHAASPEIAAALRQRFPRKKVFLGADVPAGLASDDQLEQLAKDVLQVSTRLAKRSPLQKIGGSAARAVALPRRAISLARRLGGKVVRRAFGHVQHAGDARLGGTRILFVANSFLPTLQLCFTRPLQPLVDDDQVAWQLLSDQQLPRTGRLLMAGGGRWARRRLERFRPELIVFCRYSGAYAAQVTAWARANGVPTVYHLDDDLLNVPRELGPEKYAFHNQPARLAAVRHLLDTADLVYCSTQPLLERMREHGFRGRGQAARLHCPGEALRGPAQEGVFKIGYMGIDHANDFQVALPGLVRVLERNPQVRFEIFGPIAKPAELDRFGERVTQVAYMRSYDEFLQKFAELGWAVGICPLADTAFNRFKSNNKWVEYSAVGTAVVATAGMLYDECCADGCGLLAADDGQWEAALQALIDDPARRLATVAAAQARLARDYSPVVLREQLMDLFRELRERAPRLPPPSKTEMNLKEAASSHGD